MNRTAKTLILFALSAMAMCAETKYVITPLGSPGETITLGGINDSGQVVGTKRTGSGLLFRDRAFLYSGGTMMELETFGGHSGAYVINNSGQIVVAVWNSTGSQGRLVLYSDGVMRDLEIPAKNILPAAINDAGQVVGNFNLQGEPSGFLFSAGSFIDFGIDVWAADINNSGQVVGGGSLAPFIYSYSGGVYTDIDIGPGFATAINNSGQIVGVLNKPDPDIPVIPGEGNQNPVRESAFLYSRGTVVDLGTLGGGCIPRDINDFGKIVGTCGSYLNYRAFIYSNSSMVDLNSLLINGDGWTLREAKAINRRGQIVGNGTFNGEGRAFLLTPVGDQLTPDWLVSSAGIYRGGSWFLDWNNNRHWDNEDANHISSFGLPGDQPVVGDWNGDGRSKPGVYRGGWWFLDWNGNHGWDQEDAAHTFTFGYPDDRPILGDWNRTGNLKPGVYRDGVWYVDWNGNHQWDAEDATRVTGFGGPEYLPVVSDWSGSGTLNIGVFRDGWWFLDWNGNYLWDTEDATHTVGFGAPGDRPVVGDWNGDGYLKIGVYRDGLWILDWNGNYQWDSEDAAHIFAFGWPGDLPVVGTWQP